MRGPDARLLSTCCAIHVFSLADIPSALTYPPTYVWKPLGKIVLCIHTKSVQSPRQSQRAWTQPDSLRESLY